MSKRRGHRGNGREIFGTGANDELEEIERPEDSIVVVDADGNPLDDEIDDSVIIDPDPVDDEPADDDDPLATLQREAAALRTQQQQTAAENARLQREAAALQKDNHDTTKALFTTAIETAQGGLKSAKTKYAEAMRQQDFEGAADAQAEIAQFTQEIGQLQGAVREIGDAPPARQQPKPAAPTDFNAAVEQYISTQLTPAQQTFARKHRDKIFTPDSDKNLKKVLALSNVAALEHGVDTPEFFQYIEKNMGLSDEPKPKTPVVVRTKRPAIAAAPAGRGGAKQTVQVEVTAAEREVAKRMGMTPARYALRKKQIADGAKDPEYRGPRFSRDDPATNGGR